MLILYGTETGCARDVAERVGREAARRLVAPRVVAMDDYDVGDLPDEAMVVCVCATTGDGDVPSTMASFWRFLLRRDLPRANAGGANAGGANAGAAAGDDGGGGGALAGVKFAVFGLGDSAYAQFNVVARKLHARLVQLGAAAMHPLTLGDDQSPFGLAGDVDVWLSAFWPSVLRIQPLPDDFVVDDSSKLPTLHHSLIVEDEGAATTTTARPHFLTQFYKPPMGSRPTPGGTPHACRVECNTRMTSEDWHQDVRHIVLGLAPNDSQKEGDGTADHQTLEYAAGDIAVIYPKNVFDVDSFARLMGFDPDTVFSLHPLGDEMHSEQHVALFPTPCTVRQAFCCYMDVLGTPRRHAVEMLSHFATDAVEKDKLMEIGAAKDGVDLYHSYLKREKRGFVELFADFPSCRPPLEWLVRIVPLLRPREFSISSSPRCHPREIHLAVAIVDFTSFYGQRRTGVCTNWMAKLAADASGVEEGTDLGPDVVVPLFVKRGRIHPAPADMPELLIGPGTGIAPIMSLLQDRFAARASSSGAVVADGGGDGGAVQDMVFFGCRHRSKDFLFRDDFLAMCESDDILASGESAASSSGEAAGENAETSRVGCRARLHVAFSRDQPQKVYVQHKLAEHADAVWAILDPARGNGRVVISGSSQRMPQDVLTVLKRIAILKGKLSEQEAGRFFKQMQRHGKYVLEAW
jgi:sulfite reductase alpha subunit-like flavoprotein